MTGVVAQVAPAGGVTLVVRVVVDQDSLGERSPVGDIHRVHLSLSAAKTPGHASTGRTVRIVPAAISDPPRTGSGDTTASPP